MAILRDECIVALSQVYGANIISNGKYESFLQEVVFSVIEPAKVFQVRQHKEG